MSQPPYEPIPYAGPNLPPASQRPTSVTVISIFVIIFASLGVLCSPFALLPYFVDLTQQADPINDALRANRLVNAWTIIATIAGFFISIGNLFAASWALKMRESGREWLVKLAALQLLLTFIGLCVVVIFMIPDLLAAGRANPGHDAEVIGGIIGGVAGAIIGTILPGLTVYFMTRPRIREAFANASAGYQM